MKFYLLSFLLICNIAYSQKIEFTTAKFITGDDAKYIAPNFDDSQWKTLKTNENFEPQGFENYNGFCWYRIHFYLPSSLKQNAVLKDEIEFNLSKIDDVDISYLNGVQIGTMGRLPQDVKGYETQWNVERHYVLKAGNPALHWDAENVIAIRVYDDNGGGGFHGYYPFVHFLQAIDYVTMDAFAYPFEIKEKTIAKQINFKNTYTKNISGILTSIVQLDGKLLSQASQQISLKPNATQIVWVNLPRADAATANFIFMETASKEKITNTQELPYILTPKEKPAPQINNATIFGCKPNAPFLLKIAATGKMPMQFSVDDLPNGLQVDAITGIITGAVANTGEYLITCKAKNNLGSNTKKIKILIGDDKVLVTPPMGWNSWNCWGLSVSDAKVKASANAMIQSGLINHGWAYMNIDDGWEASKRASDGSIVANTKFPDMKSLGNYLHSNGLKFGIYSSPGPNTCGGYLGSYQHEQQDANSYANWGIDYLKYDWCSYGNIVQQKPTLDEMQHPYFVMHDAINKTGRNMVFSLCQYGMGNVWQWGNKVGGNVWRTTGDIEDNWNSLKNIAFNQDVASAYNKSNYGFGDPDMLTVGFVGWGERLHQTKLTPSEQYTHISLWCLLSAPLMLGCDLSKIDAFTYNLLSNDEIIAINQDASGNGAKKIIVNDNLQVWVKQLSNGETAIGIFNLGNTSLNQNFSLSNAGLKQNYLIRDLWRQKDLQSGNNLELNIPSHGAMVLRLKKL